MTSKRLVVTLVFLLGVALLGSCYGNLPAIQKATPFSGPWDHVDSGRAPLISITTVTVTPTPTPTPTPESISAGNVAQVEPLYTLPQDDAVRFLEFSPDGETLLVSYVKNASSALWNFKAQQKISTLQIKCVLVDHWWDYFTPARFSRDGTAIFQVCHRNYETIFQAWHIDTLSSVRLSLPEIDDEIESLCLYNFSVANKGILVGSNSFKHRSGVVWYIDPWTKRQFNHFSMGGGDSGSAYCPSQMIVPRSDAILVASTWRGDIYIWDTKSGNLIRRLVGPQGHPGGVDNLAISPDETLLASTSAWDWGIRIWDLQSGALLHMLTEHKDRVTQLAFSKDSSILVSSSLDNTVRIWDVATGKNLRVLSAHQGNVNTIAFSPDGAFLATGGEDGKIIIWGLPSNR